MSTRTEEKVLSGYPTSIETALAMREFSIVSQFIEQPASERGKIVRSAIDLAIKWWDEQLVLRFLDLYRRSFYDVCLADCLRKEGFTHRADCPPNGYVIDRYSEHFIQPEDPDWRRKVYDSIAGGMAHMLTSLPAAGDSISSISPIQPAFPELKKALVEQMLAHADPSYAAAALIKLEAETRHEEIGKLYRSIARRVTESCNESRCAKLLTFLIRSKGQGVNMGIREMLMRSALIRLVQLSDEADIDVLAKANVLMFAEERGT